ncbi:MULTISPECIES: porin [Luteimonas]|nr:MULTISPECIES: porin [Luteimonas]
MRHSILAASVALAVASVSFSAAAQSQGRDAEVAALRAQLAEMQAKLDALELRSDAQSDINIGTQESLDRMATTMPVVDTKGGLKVTSADKKFEFSAGGRIHFDAYAFDRDEAASTGTTEFRRARITLGGKAYGWEYKFEQDFGAGSGLDGFRDVYIARSALGGKFTIGHFKPYRSMEELTSSNEILMMERPFASATGLFNGRQFQQGVGYMRADGNHTAGVSVFNLRSASGTRNEGVGAAGRVTFAPINTEESTLHFGGWASQENANQGSADLAASVSYAGRRGPSQVIATTTGASRDTVTAVGVEAAGSFGPLFFQAEYANATFGRPLGADQDVATWYVQGSWLLNGGHKPYKPTSGIFGSPKVTDKGLWELTARYDTIENKDIRNMDVSSWIVGMNYYVNPSLRFMFNYTNGDDSFTGDKTGQYALRTQFSF